MTSQLEPLKFPLYGSRLIEASAGTGKTYTIAALYLRLILRHGGENAFAEDLLPPDILVLTFTEAATAELKDRIRARLAEAATVFTGQVESQDDYLSQLLDEYKDAEEREKAAKLLDKAAQWMDEAAVSTIHGWCYRMLREHAFASSSLFDLELLSDTHGLLQELCQDYWRRFFYSYSSDALNALGLPSNPNALLGQIYPLLNLSNADVYMSGQKVPAVDDLPSNEEIVAAVEQQRAATKAIQKRFADNWSAINENLLALYPYLNKQSFNKIKTEETRDAFLESLRAWCTEDAEEPVHFHLLGATTLESKLSKKAPAGLAIHDAFISLDGYLEQKTDTFLAKEILLVHASRWVAEKQGEYMRNTASVSFNDMLSNLHKVLEGPQGEQLASNIRKQFPVILVDEFQDTDPIQYAIFNRIYRVEDNQEDSGIFLIGDPKQAIYGFRGADIFTYLKARQATQGRHYSLVTNFRSSKAMVDASNALFQWAEQHPQAAFRYKTDDENQLPFQVVEAKGKKQDWYVNNQAGSALSCWWLPGEDGKPLGADDYRTNMAEACASEIVRLLSNPQTGFYADGNIEQVRSRDIAILVRSRAEADTIRQALSKRYLPSVYLSEQGSIFSEPQALEVSFLLQAVAEPSNEQAIRRVLASASLNLSYTDILDFDEDENTHEAILERFFILRETWRRQGVLPMIRQFMQLHQLAEQLAQKNQGERAITNWLHLAEWLQQQSLNAESEKALIRLLEQQINQSSSENENILRLESDADLIKVVTIHKSKGLQYPIVFLPFIANCREATGKDGSYFYQQGDQRILELDSSHNAAKQAREKERLDEDIRLLYVAITRAEFACYMGLGDIRALSKSAIYYLLMGASGGKTDAFAQTLEKLAAPSAHISLSELPEINNTVYRAEAITDFAPARDYAKRPLENWWVASYSALKYADTDYLESAKHANLLESGPSDEADSITHSESRKAKQSLHNFPRGAQAGIFLHEVLERLAKYGFSYYLENPDELREYLVAKCQAQQWQQWSDVVQHWLLSYTQTDFKLGEQSLRLCDVKEYQVEMEFWLSVNHTSAKAMDALISHYVLPDQPRPPLDSKSLNGMLRGFIDLVFEHNGQYYIADYKSNHLGDNDQAYTQEAMEQAILAKRYDVQYVLYTLALHRLLKARLSNYNYENDIGGAVYFFLRGSQAESQGVFYEKPDQVLIEGLDALFMQATEANHV